MKQQVNLYLELPQRGAVVLPFDALVRLSRLFALVLIFIFLILLANNFWLSTRLKKITFAKKQTTERLAVYKKRLAKADTEKQKGQLISLLNNELQVKTKIVSALSQQALSNIAGFSMYLEGLAKHISAGVWLNSIEIKNGAKNMTFSGQAIRTADALRFLKNLSNADVFANRKFELSELSTAGNKDQPLNFVLRTQEVR